MNSQDQMTGRTGAGRSKLNKILKDLQTKKKKVNIVKENENQIATITNLKQKLMKREQIILDKINNSIDPLLKIELSGYVEELRDIMNKFDEMINHLLKINKYCLNKNLVGGVSYNQVSNTMDNIEMMPHLASYYEGSGIKEDFKKGWEYVKENPWKSAAYGIGALGLANILTNPSTLDAF